MKLTSSITALAAILGLALASAPVTVQAQTTTTPAATAAPAKKAKPVEYDGNITAIDATSVTVATTKKVLTLAIAPTTKYKKDKKAATIADFAIGDKVTGSYTKDASGNMTAYSIHKTTLTAAATKTAKASATNAVNSATPAAVPAPAMPAGQ